MHEGASHAVQDFIYLHDNVELTTIGVDVGSSTFHLMFAKVHLQRETHEHSSRFEVVSREVLWRSEIQLTPYSGRRIDAEAVRAFVARSHREAGLEPSDVDSGAVILTGEALRQHNARSLADAIAAGSGKFVCVSAGHHLESMLAAFGSGAVRYSEDHQICLLHIDIGGGTTKLSVIDRGTVVATAAVMIGGRQIALSKDRLVVSTSAGSTTVARSAGIDLQVGEFLSEDDERRFVEAQVAVILDLANHARSSSLERRIRLTRVLPQVANVDAVSFSGGVSEYIYGRERQSYGDLGPQIGRAIRRAIANGEFSHCVVDPGEGIRATVAGASQCSVQLSGSTVLVTDHNLLPLHNIPVVHPDPANRLGEVQFNADAVATSVTRAIADYGLDASDRLALAFNWVGDPSYARLNGFAAGIHRALGDNGRKPVAVLIDQDIGKSIGRLLAERFAGARPVICLDGLTLSPLDFVDIGQVIEPSGALPVVIKSLLFSSDHS